MNWSKIILYSTIGALTLGSVSCGNSNNSNNNLESKIQHAAPITKSISGQNYQFEANKVSQLTSDEDNHAKYGVISDAHGEVAKAEAFAKKFKELGVDGIILPGDLAVNEFLRYGQTDSKSDKKEICDVLEAVAKIGLPVFVIPGNHERTLDYESALSEITAKYSNVIDMTKYRIFDGDDADFVTMPGYQTFSIPGKQFIPDDGYFAEPNRISATGKLRGGLDDAVVLITHGAGKTNTDGKMGPATIYSGKDVGDANTTQMMVENNIPVAVVGHIHEAGGYAATYDGKLIPQGEFAEQFTANFGTLEKSQNINGQTYEAMAGILTMRGNEAKFEMLYIK